MTGYAWLEVGTVPAYALLLIVIFIWPDGGDDVDVEDRLAPYTSQAAHDYAARRLIAEATSDIPYRLLEEWVEQ